MKLWYAPDTIAVAVALALEEAGLDYDLQRVDFAKAEQQEPDFLALNPKGRVPALKVDGEIFTETGAILEYIAARAPQARLVPDGATGAARMREVMYYLASTMHVNHAHKKRGHRWADQEASWADMSAKVPHTMTDAAAHVEANCLEGPLVLGALPCLADFYLFVICTWLPGDGVDVQAFPKLQAFLAAMEARASVKAVRVKGMLS